MHISRIVATVNALTQFLILSWYFVTVVYQDIKSVSYCLHSNNIFMISITATILIENFLVVLFAFSANERRKQQLEEWFLFITTCVLINCIGWIMVVVYYDSTLHYAGTILFIVSIIPVYFLLVIYHEQYEMVFGALYTVAAICILAFGISYVTGNDNVSFYVEWSAFFIYSVTNILFYYMIAFEIF
jgi:hypothetical protein